MQNWEFYLFRASDLNSKILGHMWQVTLGFMNNTSMSFQKCLTWQSTFHNAVQTYWRPHMVSDRKLYNLSCFFHSLDRVSKMSQSKLHTKRLVCNCVAKSNNKKKVTLCKDSVPLHIFLRCGCDLDFKVSLHCFT